MRKIKITFTKKNSYCEDSKSEIYLEWNVRDSNIGRKYFTALKIAADTKYLYQRDRFHNFKNCFYTENTIVDQINKSIDIINFKFPNLIPEKAHLGMSQDYMNHLHIYFEKFRGPILSPNPIYIEAGDFVRNAFDNLNIMIHRYEDAGFSQKKTSGSTLFHVNFGTSEIVKRYKLEDSDFDEFTFECNFGTWLISYCEVGKPLHDVWADSDGLIGHDAILPLSYYSADALVYMGDSVTQTQSLIQVASFYDWWDEHQSYLESLGFKKFEKKNALGNIPVAELDRNSKFIKNLSNQEIVDLLSEYQWINRVEYFDDDDTNFNKLLAYRDNKTPKMNLDEISSSFCTVKWKHATINLGSGAVKSCCHLPFRKVSLENIKNNLQLHETSEDRNERAQMLAGQRPKDCSYCWWIEDKGHISDRVSWSSEPWMAPYTEDIGKQGSDQAQNPSWVELNFSNVCNLKCSYCSPIFSTKWLQEIKAFGPYPTDPGHNDVNYLKGLELDENYDNTELAKQFWTWFDQIYSDLRLLKITGGEPLLSPHTFKVLESVFKRPNTDMLLSINSNSSVPEAQWKNFTDLVSKITKEKKVKKFCLQPSIDSFGARAEYIRHGLNFDLFKKNIESYLEKCEGDIVFICTLNNLALAGLLDLWKYILSLKKKYAVRGQWISITSEVLMAPDWQNINILPSEFQAYLVQTIQFVKMNLGSDLSQFSEIELQSLYRGLEMMKSVNPEKIAAKKNFYKFFSEHDRRRSTHFLQTFPELHEFWNDCMKITNSVS